MSDANGAAHPGLPAALTAQLAQLFSAGFSLLPLGGPDGKKPIVAFRDRKRLPLNLVVDRMAAAGSRTYGIRLGGLLVVDVDTDTPEARDYVERRFGTSPVRTRTGRGYHLYFRYSGDQPPKAVRLPEIAIDFKCGPNAFVVGPVSVRPDGTEYRSCGPLVGYEALPEFRALEPQPVNEPATADADGEFIAGDGLHRRGTRHTALKRQAMALVRSATSYEALVTDLKLFRDKSLERPEEFGDDHIEGLAGWFWEKREAGELWGAEDSTYSLSRSETDRLLQQGEFVAFALHAFLVLNHGHKPNAEFAIVPDALIRSGRIKAGRRQLYAAIQVLLEANLLKRINKPRGKRDPFQYRLCQGGEEGGERSILTLVSSSDTQDDSFSGEAAA